MRRAVSQRGVGAHACSPQGSLQTVERTRLSGGALGATESVVVIKGGHCWHSDSRMLWRVLAGALLGRRLPGFQEDRGEGSGLGGESSRREMISGTRGRSRLLSIRYTHECLEYLLL